MITLDYYRVFQTVADCGSFSGAAKRLFISQSAVSQSVMQLEKQTGCRLFTRHSKGVTLTREGAMLYEYANAALKLLFSGEEKLQKMRELEEGNLKIGAGDTISENLLLPALEQFHRQYPSISLAVVNRTSSQAIGLLKEGAIDIAFVNLPLSQEDMDGLQVKEVQSVQDIFVAGQAFGFLRGRTLSLEELTQYPLIMLEEASSSRRYVSRIFAKNGIAIRPEIELGAHSLLLEFAKIGLGLSCVIREFSQHALTQGPLFEIALRQSLPPRRIGICTLSKVSPSFAARQFMERF